MLGHKLILSKAGNKRRQLSTFVAFSMYTVPLDNQVVDKGRKFLFAEVFQLIHKLKLLDYCCFANQNIITDLVNDSQ